MGPAQEQVYQLLTSTRFDPFLATLSWNNDHNGPCSFFLLPYHFDRLTSAAKAHKWDHSLLTYDYLHSTCLDAVSESKERGLPNDLNPSSSWKVNPFLCCISSFLNYQIDSNHTFTKRSDRRDCNSSENNFGVRSNFSSIR